MEVCIFSCSEGADYKSDVEGPPNMKTFRENLEGKGVPAIVCDMLFSRCCSRTG